MINTEISPWFIRTERASFDVYVSIFNSVDWNDSFVVNLSNDHSNEMLHCMKINIENEIHPIEWQRQNGWNRDEYRVWERER